MPYTYHIYGLTLVSPQALPYLTDATSNNEPDVTLSFAGNDFLSSLPSPDSFQFSLLADRSLCFSTVLSSGCAEFVIQSDGRAIRVAQLGDPPFLEIMRYITGVSLGAVLRFRGILCFHASAVAVNGSALMFVGPSHAGKSTLSAAFDRRGNPLISEDVVALDQFEDRVCIRPGYAGVRLYADSLLHLYDVAAANQALPVDTKYLHRLQEIPSLPCPVKAIYLLARRNPELRQPKITPLNNLGGLIALTNQLYLYNYGEQAWLARDFPRIGQLMQAVPINVLERTNTLSDLDATIDLLLEDQLAAK